MTVKSHSPHPVVCLCSFPWMVQLFDLFDVNVLYNEYYYGFISISEVQKTFSRLQPACGGTMISHNVVMTAAHCLNGSDPTSWQVRTFLPAGCRVTCLDHCTPWVHARILPLTPIIFCWPSVSTCQLHPFLHTNDICICPNCALHDCCCDCRRFWTVTIPI